MLNKAHLQDLLSDKNKASFERNPTQPIPPTSPTHVKVINVISGGSDVCGLTYSIAKRIAREGTPSSAVYKSCRFEEECKLEAMGITFDDDDVCEAEHHDGLVISLTVSNCLFKRVLVDGGSSANIIFKSALEGMGLCEKDITKKFSFLVGFSGEAQHTVGEITLPTVAKGVNLPTRLNVVDWPSAYNFIIDTP